jgi:hypothetical protein
VRVLREAPTQIPNSCQAKILLRIDGAGAAHGLLTWTVVRGMRPDWDPR